LNKETGSVYIRQKLKVLSDIYVLSLIRTKVLNEKKWENMAAPKKAITRKKHIDTRLTDEEYLLISSKAKGTGVSNSEYLRSLGMNYPLRSVVDEVAYTLLSKAHGDLGRLGGLFKYWQTKQEYPINMGKRSFRDIDELVDEIERKQKEILELARKLLEKI